MSWRRRWKKGNESADGACASVGLKIFCGLRRSHCLCREISVLQWTCRSARLDSAERCNMCVHMLAVGFLTSPSDLCKLVLNRMTLRGWGGGWRSIQPGESFACFPPRSMRSWDVWRLAFARGLYCIHHTALPGHGISKSTRCSSRRCRRFTCSLHKCVPPYTCRFCFIIN